MPVKRIRADYADQRYYAVGMGRFSTPDPSSGTDAADPSSWNMYAYVQGDPINYLDESGLQRGDVNCKDDPESPSCQEPKTKGPGQPITKPVRKKPIEKSGPNAGGDKQPGLFAKSLSRVEDRLKDGDCVNAIGGGSYKDVLASINDTGPRLADIGAVKLTRNADGSLSQSADWTGLGTVGVVVLPNGNLGHAAELNTQVNWADPQHQTAVDQNGSTFSYDLLAGMGARIGFSGISSDQLMDLVLLHELAHTFGETHPEDPTAYDRNIWTNCFKNNK
jgi:RHS repeat-associated protein